MEKLLSLKKGREKQQQMIFLEENTLFLIQLSQNMFSTSKSIEAELVKVLHTIS